MMYRFKSIALLAVMSLALIACGIAEGTESDPAPGQGVDVGEPNNGAAGTCLVGTPDCVDADLGDGSAPPSVGMCASETPDCVDTVVIGDGNDGSDVDYRPIEPEGELPGDGHVVAGEVIAVESNLVTVGFWMGVEDCYGVERVEVAETDTKVAVDITVAEREVGTACIALAEARSVTVELSRPLEGRILEIGGVTISR